MKTKLLAAAIAAILPSSALADGSKLNYDALSVHLKENFTGCEVRDKSATDKRTTCLAAGQRSGYAPSARVEVSLRNGQVVYTLTIFAADQFAATMNPGTFQDIYNNSIALIDDWGKRFGDVTPTLTSVVNECVKNSEIQTNQGNCRLLSKFEKYSVGIWGEVGREYFGYRLTVQVSKDG
ncbi:hypothetical protein QTA58_23450 [Neorhizobium sp. CSC1952]|uniref:hypothetical protein n=1 Tax=Neorhizobium sp. CSC1952 TaxID=2978974 RepID=UPI0025A51279|nr:hypothetical protein [Rhizobium sp. CSC1952]WJR67098.1 hypothetical protein QTA58_23450 [Rhizobium sp. CSC1952]